MAPRWEAERSASPQLATASRLPPERQHRSIHPHRQFNTFLFNKDGRLLCGPSMGMKDIKWKSPFLSRKQQVSKEKEQTTEEHTSSSKPTVQVDTHRVDRSEIDPRWANGHPPGGPGHLPVPEGVDEGRGWRVGRWKVNGEGNLCISSEVEEVLCLRLIS